MKGCYPIPAISCQYLPVQRDPCRDRKTNWKRADRLISVDATASASVDSTDSTGLTCAKSSDATTAVAASTDADRNPNWRIPKWTTTSTRPQTSLKTAAAMENRLTVAIAYRANRRHPSPWPSLRHCVHQRPMMTKA